MPSAGGFDPESRFLELTRWNYNQYGRVTNKLDAANVTNFIYAYDASDRITNRVDALNRHTRFEYDPVGNLTNVVYPTVTLRYAFDALNRLTNVVCPAGAFGYEYLPGVTNGSTSASSLIRKLTLPGGSYITNAFYTVGRELSTALKNSSGSILNSHAYQYDLAGRRKKQTLTDGSYPDYTYDGLGQLQSATGKESGGTTRLHENSGYAYDPAGNLSKRTNNALIQTKRGQD